mmetsp:Transcript_99033/g.278341  ORF Transcript_99033/g.278341 Transcript_99033/m.278341 type:complete len:110 (+) Transcript_99033:67-396(+)
MESPAGDERMAAACATEKPFEALHALARALLHEGVSQQELYQLFDVQRSLHEADDDESVYNAVLDVMDYIVGWCAVDHESKLCDAPASGSNAEVLAAPTRRSGQEQLHL